MALALLGGCATLDSINPFSDSKPAAVAEKTPQTPEGLYNNGVDALHSGRYALAVTQFENIQQNYPYSGFTANAQLIEGYAYYLQDHYSDAVLQIDRFLQLHPTSQDAAYAYYLRALCYYEQIADIQRDQQGTVQAMNALQDVVTRFPDTAYARDARLKIDLCRDHLAGKEMLIGRYYEQQHYYEAAINRYQRVVRGLPDHQPRRRGAAPAGRGLPEARPDRPGAPTAAVLGYNYPGSTWYQDSYADLRQAGALQPGDNPAGQPAAPAQNRGFLGRAYHSVF